MSKTFAKDYLKRGSHNVICDRCGFKYKAEELRKEWQGFMTCNTCWEPRHPQDLIRSVRDQRPKSYYRPEPQPLFISNNTHVLTAGAGVILTDGNGNPIEW